MLKINKKKLMPFFCFMVYIGLIGCSDEAENDNINHKKINSKSIETNKSIHNDMETKSNHWLVDKDGQLRSNIVPTEKELDDQEINLLEQDRKDKEEEIKHLILEMDDNLDAPELKKSIQEEFKKRTKEYKQRVLLLAKEKLKKSAKN